MTYAPTDCSPALADVSQRTLRTFDDLYDSPPNHLVAAPGRVNLIGEHIDYNDGFVMPMAIDRYVAIAASIKNDSKTPFATVHSVDLDDTVEIPIRPQSTPSVGHWGRYIEGVISGFVERGIEVPAFQAVLASNVPHGGGLSSSAALEVATATLVEQLTGEKLSKIAKALLCQKAEHDFAGVPCGIMDQFSSVFGQDGQLMLIDCRSEDCRMVPFDSPDISMLIINSNVKHELSGGEYASRRADCDQALVKVAKKSWRDVSMSDIDNNRDKLSDTEFLRGRHVVSEIARTAAAAEALRRSDWNELGKLMLSSHASLRDDFEVSCPELDILVEIAEGLAEDGGVIGSRMTGGGFGGCTVTLVHNGSLRSVIEIIERQYKERTGLDCSCFSSRPAVGAHVLSIPGESH